MRWPWHQRTDDAERDLADAERRLDDVRSNWPEVLHAARALDDRREANGFAEQIRAAMGVHR